MQKPQKNSQYWHLKPHKLEPTVKFETGRRYSLEPVVRVANSSDWDGKPLASMTFVGIFPGANKVRHYVFKTAGDACRSFTQVQLWDYAITEFTRYRT